MMNQKRENMCLKKVSVKTNRKSLSLTVKLDVIKRIEAGERQIDVCKALDLAGSTVRCILKNEDKIKECGKTEPPLSATKLNRTRSSNLIEMERLLMLFIENNVQRRVSHYKFYIK
jgi:hypothetical protein